MSRPRLVALLLVLGTLAAYLPAARNGFVDYDDDQYVTDNPVVKNGLSLAGIQWAFTTVYASNWHPLTWISHMLDCTLFGLNPAAHHFVNVFFHAANTALLFALWWRLTGRLWPSAMVAALFSWHPVHVESVAWIAERKDLLCTFFWILTLLAYAQYATGESWITTENSPFKKPTRKGRSTPPHEPGRIAGSSRRELWLLTPALSSYGEEREKQWTIAVGSRVQCANCLSGDSPPTSSSRGEGTGGRGLAGAVPNLALHFMSRGAVFYWISLFCYALALLSKPMAVTLPFVLLLLDYWPLNRIEPGRSVVATARALVVEKIPFFLLTAASCVITVMAQSHGGAVATLADVPSGLRIENAAVALASYLAKVFWPAPLAVIYPLRPVSGLAIAASVLLLAGVSYAVWRLGRRNRCWPMGWLWFLGTLAPVIGIVQVGNAAMADRYTYVPYVGIFLALAFGLSGLAEKFSRLKNKLPAISALVLAASLALMEWQLHYWRDSETLFRHAIAVTHDNSKAHLDLAVALEQQGRFDEAIVEYREALRIDPNQVQLHYNIGCLEDKLGRPSESLAEFREATRLRPGQAAWHCAEGMELVELGQGGEALKEFADASRLEPGDPQPHIETAKYFFQRGRDEDGVNALHEALKCKPETFQTLATAAHYLAANENATARDGRVALELATQADALSGHDQPMVLDVLGMAYAETGDFTNATACAQTALDLATTAKLKSVDALQKRLKLYQNGQPWHESFRGMNH